MLDFEPRLVDSLDLASSVQNEAIDVVSTLNASFARSMDERGVVAVEEESVDAIVAVMWMCAQRSVEVCRFADAGGKLIQVDPRVRSSDARRMKRCGVSNDLARVGGLLRAEVRDARNARVFCCDS